jgi:DNA-directed RNA polymerase subunit omega
MNPELCRQALLKVGNPNVLVNLISRRVRQLNAGGGGSNRPLINTVESLGAADTALLEIVEGKMGWEMPDYKTLVAETKPRRKRRS